MINKLEDQIVDIITKAKMNPVNYSSRQAARDIINLIIYFLKGGE